MGVHKSGHEKMGFSDMSIEWIRRCVTSIKYHVIFNGQPRGNIVPKRELRQGDPLSPFIYILCTEVIISFLNYAESKGKITGMRVSRASPPISHMLFAEDSLFFVKAELRECNEVMKAIMTYRKASGQFINYDNLSSLLFGKKISMDVKEAVKISIGIANEGDMGSYLGIPEDISGSNKNYFLFSKRYYKTEPMAGQGGGCRKEERRFS